MNQENMRRFSEAVSNVSFVAAAAEFDQMWKRISVRKLFATNLQVLRGIRNLNMVELAARVGYNHTHLSRLESCNGNCSFELALKLSQALGISLQALLTVNMKRICETAIMAADITERN